MAGRFSVEAVFRAIDRVTAPVSRMQNRVGKFTRGMSRGFDKLDRKVSKFSKGLNRAAKVGIAATGLLATVAVGNLVKTGAEFEQAITNVGAVSMQTRAQIAPLEQQALQLGRTTKFTATQSAEAMEVLARAGFNTQEILKATPAVLSAAAASGLEIAEVANQVSNVLKGMGLEVGRAAEVADVLALASSRTNSTIGSLGESMSNVASTARQLNVPLKDAVASVALLQDVGLDASVAGSAMNTMLTKMAAPTVGMQKKMRRLGITFKDTEGNMLPLPKVLQQLSTASNRVGGNFDKVAFLAELVGLRGQKAASNLSTLFETGKLEKLTKELGNAKGAADKMAELRMDTVTGSFQLLTSALDAVKVRIFNMNSGPLKDAIDQMTKWVGLNESLIAQDITQGIQNVLPSIAILAKAVTSIATGFVEMGRGIGIIAAKVSLWEAPTVAEGAQGVSGFLERGFGQIAEVTGLSALGRFTERAVSQITGGLIGGDPQVVSPQERVAASIEEKRTTSTAEVTIKDETGRAEVTSGKMGKDLNLLPSGAF